MLIKLNDKGGHGVWFDPSQIVTIREGTEFSYARMRDGNVLEFPLSAIDLVAKLEAAGVLVYDAMEEHPF